MDINPEEREFFVQLVDEASFVAVDEYPIGSWSIEKLCRLLECDPALLSPGEFFFLEGDLRRRIESVFALNLDKADCEANLISWSKSDGLPYRTHAGRELILMRNGLKPLSVFTSMIPSEPDAFDIPVHLFAPFVDKGAFIVRNYCEPLEENARFYGVEVALYAATHEAWRLDAYILLRSTARRTGWTEPLIRMEGTLLGYAEWQNDAFIVAREPVERNGA